MNRLQQIEARLAEIRGLLETPEADLEALESEISALENERAAINHATEQRAALVARVVGAPAAQVVHSFPAPGTEGAHQEERTFDAASPEYRTAFLKNLAHVGGQWRLGEMTDVEERAFTYLTSTTAAVLPTGIQLGIVDMISEKYALLSDLSPTGFAGAVEFQQATAIVSGEAAETSENTPNDENLRVTFVKVTMTGVEIRGSVKIGRKMQLQSIDGFETWLTTELAREMGAIMNAHAWDAISTDMAAGNKFTPATLADSDVRGMFAVMKGAEGSRVVYANNYTIWTYIADVETGAGDPAFIASMMDSDPAVQGRIYGALVKLDDTLADGVIYGGYPATVKANTFEAPNVLSEVDVETREVLHAGYALFEARLGDTRSWSKVTIEEASV